jgi:hypothetical protein
MEGLTRGGVAYDLNKSPFRLEVPYEGETLVFVFSSALYRQKFYDRFLDNRETVSASLSRLVGYKIESDLLCDLKLYARIEKRGFLILKNEVKFVCREDIISDGHKVTKRS